MTRPPTPIRAAHEEDEEHHVWSGRPSQLLNLPAFLGLAVAAGAVTALLVIARPVLMSGVSVETGALAIRAFPWLIAGVWLPALLAALVRAVRTASVRYDLTSERLRRTTGLLSTTTDEVELRRVRDFTVRRPFWQRLAGLGEVHLTTADPSHPAIVLRGVHDPDGLQNTMRRLVQGLIRKYGVREMDIY